MTDGLRFISDPRVFLRTAASYLEADPVLCTVVASMAEREADGGRESPPGSPYWYLTVHDGVDAVVGLAMRTAPYPPHDLFVLPMPDEAALDLARALHRRGEAVEGVNGAMSTAYVVADETARLTGGVVEVALPTRLYQLRRLQDRASVTGGLQPATLADLDLVVDWVGRFHGDADRQAGRTLPDQPQPDQPRPDQPRPDPELLASRIDAGRYWLWRVQRRAVQLSGVNPVSFGVQRISLVYTPAEQRGRGWAGAAVAQLSRQILAAGARPCLYTDLENPVSNHLYTALGFEPVVDMVNLAVRRSQPAEQTLG